MSRLLEILLVAIAAGAAGTSLVTLPRAVTTRWRGAAQPPEGSPEQLVRLERLVSTSGFSPVTVHAYLRPLLAEIASQRLAVRGRSLDRLSNTAGEQLLGERLWDIVRPSRPFPEDRYGPGLSPAELCAMLEVLERL